LALVIDIEGLDKLKERNGIRYVGTLKAIVSGGSLSKSFKIEVPVSKETLEGAKAEAYRAIQIFAGTLRARAGEELAQLENIPSLRGNL